MGELSQCYQGSSRLAVTPEGLHGRTHIDVLEHEGRVDEIHRIEECFARLNIDREEFQAWNSGRESLAHPFDVLRIDIDPDHS